jgi:hypothetical protein
MNRSVASLLLVLACAGTALADDPPSHVAPFLDSSDDGFVHAVTGAFGPAKNTTIVVTFNFMGIGQFKGFALVPDAKAKDGHRKLALPRLPAGSMSGTSKVALVANLDKDDADELVIEFDIQDSVSGPEGGFSFSTVTYRVLDWDGKQFVRVAALEKKLETKMKSRAEGKTNPLTEADIRAALGVAKKK